jgi:hypothetical protein
MRKIDKNTGALIAAETKGALRALDDAILTELRLCTTLIEAFDQSNLPVTSSQKLLQTLASGLNHIVAGRGEMASTVRALTAIKSASSLNATSYNCPGEQSEAMLPAAFTAERTCPETVLG